MKTYNDGLEAAARLFDQQAKATIERLTKLTEKRIAKGTKPNYVDARLRKQLDYAVRHAALIRTQKEPSDA